jgi:primosomal protein N' (replication factor Y)
MTEQTEYIHVALPLPIAGSFCYRIRPELRERVLFGRRVLAPFRNKIRAGFIIGASAEPPGGKRKSDIKEVLDIPEEAPFLTPNVWQLIKWISSYYMILDGVVLRTALPPGSDRKSKPWAILTPEGRTWFGGRGARDTLKLPATLLKRGVMLRSDLEAAIGEGGVEEALNRDWLRIEERIARPRTTLRKSPLPGLLDPAGSHSIEREAPPRLTEEQETAISHIRKVTADGGFNPFLLYGVTGSGKTEVYLRLIEDALEQSKRALVLVPEIALTPQLATRFLKRLGGGVALFHSGLTPAQRLDEWRRIHSGSVSVVIGARSGIFVPLQDLGLIVVDEEHDSSYKQADSCPYHARDMALTRGYLEKTTVVLGSATPSFETFLNARKGKLTRLDLRTRPHGGALPRVELVDLRTPKILTRGSAFLSKPLISAIGDVLERRQQAVLFINRRGFDTFAQCGDCGYVFKCPNCDVSLTHHKRQRDLRCHLCGYAQAAPPLCPQCSGARPQFGGVGTQKVEEVLLQLFPDARIERLDRDSTRKRDELESLLERFRNKQIDIMTGTQMIVKGHDFPGISLVGVLCGDLSLHFPDFRAAEKTFQLITQVSGRTGRAEDSGKVLLQTFDPDHDAIRLASGHAYEDFFAIESELRNELLYPPYGHLILVRIEGNDEERVENKAIQISSAARMLKKAHAGVMILGPAPCPRKKAIGRHRWQVLFKAEDRAPVRNLLLQLNAQEIFKGHGLKIVIDVDPIDMM